MQDRDHVVKTYTAPAVERAMDVLQMLASRPRGFTLSQIALALRLPKSTLLGILTGLERKGMVVRDPVERRYRLGVGAFQVGRRYLDGVAPPDALEAAVRELVGASRETFLVAVLDGADAVYVARVSGEAPVAGAPAPGDRVPAWESATGMALLAWPPDVDRHGAAILPEAADGPAGEQLARVRERGFAERHVDGPGGAYAVAAPVLDWWSRVHAAVGIWAPAAGLTEADRAELPRLAVAVARRLAESIHL